MTDILLPGLEPHHDGSMVVACAEVVSLGTDVRLEVEVPPEYPLRRGWVRTVVDGEPRFLELQAPDHGASRWAANVPVANPLVRYRFLLELEDHSTRWLNATGSHRHDVNDRDDHLWAVAARSPAWLDGQLVYQVFPDRFAASGQERALPDWARASDWDEPVVGDGDAAPSQVYGGDLDGITAHLDHLVELGVGVLYLTPVWPARSSHRYDATTFDRVDPLLGGDEALRRLVIAAHERRIRVIGDLTLNHSGVGHDWFRRAVRDRDGEEAAFYLFDDHPDGYDCWLGVRSLPRFDHRSAELRRRLYDGPGSIVARWTADPTGLDGWRIDVANMAGRHADVDANHDLARTVRRTLEGTGRELLLLAEHAHDAAPDLPGDGWHGTMAYAWFTRPLLSWLAADGEDPDLLGELPPVRPMVGADLVASIRHLSAGLPWPMRLASLNLLGSHDTPRARDLYGDAWPVAAAALFTLPGLPMVFAGDEVGVTGATADAARQPFPWDPDAWDARTFDTYRRLSDLRRQYPALRHGGLRWLAVHDDMVLFSRTGAGGDVLVQLSRAAHPPVGLPTQLLGAGGLHPIDDAPPLVDEGGCIRLAADGPSFHLWHRAS